MKRHSTALGILMFFLSTLPVYAGAPLDTVQTNVNKVLDVLRDPKLKAESAKRSKKRNSMQSMNRCSMKSNFPCGSWGELEQTESCSAAGVHPSLSTDTGKGLHE